MDDTDSAQQRELERLHDKAEANRKVDNYQWAGIIVATIWLALLTAITIAVAFSRLNVEVHIQPHSAVR